MPIVRFAPFNCGSGEVRRQNLASKVSHFKLLISDFQLIGLYQTVRSVPGGIVKDQIRWFHLRTIFFEEIGHAAGDILQS